MKPLAWKLLLPSLLLVVATPVVAESTPLTYDRFNITVSVEREVENDVLVAVLFAERSGGDQARLSGEVNEVVGAALEQAKQVAAVKAQTLGYDTSPLYQDQVLRGWRVRQSLRLESRDADVLAGLLGKLQASLALASLGYEVSPEARAKVEDELVANGLQAFERRAVLVASSLNRASHRIVHADINTGGGFQPPMMVRGAVMAMESADSSAPVLEAGTQTLTVTVSGTIELAPGP